ncbi:MAG: diguanylate cyclase [Desulfobacterales bacterium]|jgi:diguanylate cyclase (GGDEF)-like protein
MQKKATTLIILGFLAVSLALVYDWGLSRLHVFRVLQLQLTDTLYRYRNRHTPRSSNLENIVVVGIDDASLKNVDHRWPWSRDILVNFFETLQHLNPKVIGFDFALVGSSPDVTVDEALAQAMANPSNTIIAGYFDEQNDLIQSHRRFREAAVGQGFIDIYLDVDGTNRKSTFFKVLNDRQISYSFACATAASYLGHFPGGHNRSPLDLIPDKLNSSSWSSQRYRPEAFSYISFWKMLDKQVKPEEIEGKIVLVGTVDPIFHDIHKTALGLMAGIYVNANDVVSMLDQDFVREVLTTNRWFFFLVLSALFMLLIFRLNAFAQLAVFLVAEAGVYLTTLFLFSRNNILLEPFSPLFILAVTFTVVVFYKVLRTFLENLALHQQVVTDPLTGLYGQRYLLLKLEKIFKNSIDKPRDLCVAMLDADHFKRVNDTYGHDEGNRVLIEIAKIIKQHIRRNDIAARFGGEEFTLIFNNTALDGAFKCVERMRQAIEQTRFSHPTGAYGLTVSGGIVSNQHPDVYSSKDMIKFADKELYRAKSEGRNRTYTAEQFSA